MQEYPKSLYLNGSWDSVNQGLHVIANDEDEELGAREKGYRMLSEGEVFPESSTKTKEELVAEAEELGIEVKGNWGVPKLTEEIEKARAK